MGATGFEPVAAWSEAKYSVQTELSALAPFYWPGSFKRRGFDPACGGVTNSLGDNPVPIDAVDATAVAIGARLPVEREGRSAVFALVGLVRIRIGVTDRACDFCSDTHTYCSASGVPPFW